MLWDRYNRIPHPAPKHQTKKEHVQLRRHKIKTTREKSQEDSSFPAGDHKTILYKRTIRQRHNLNRKLTNITIRINHNRSTDLVRLVINYWVGWA